MLINLFHRNHEFRKKKVPEFTQLTYYTFSGIDIVSGTTSTIEYSFSYTRNELCIRVSDLCFLSLYIETMSLPHIACKTQCIDFSKLPNQQYEYVLIGPNDLIHTAVHP